MHPLLSEGIASTALTVNSHLPQAVLFAAICLVVQEARDITPILEVKPRSQGHERNIGAGLHKVPFKINNTGMTIYLIKTSTHEYRKIYTNQWGVSME